MGAGKSCKTQNGKRETLHGHLLACCLIRSMRRILVLWLAGVPHSETLGHSMLKEPL